LAFELGDFEMFKRKIYNELLEWKESRAPKSALLIEGARRIGKTTLVSEFAKNEYESYLLIDFSLVSGEFTQVFLDLRTNIDAFFSYLEATFGTTLKDNKTLIVFDEVQLFPKAREFIKHLVADGRYHYIETGSLISLKSNVQDILLPSEEESIQMHPMDFEEFLWAMEEQPLANLMKESSHSYNALPDDLHRKAMRLWGEYTLVGGMPEVVNSYKTSRNFEQVYHDQTIILGLYRNDIEKYGERNSKQVKAIFDAIPGALSEHDKKLVWSEISQDARSRTYEQAIKWLEDSSIVNLAVACTEPSLSLALSAKWTSIKCYMGDTGLLTAQSFRSQNGVISDVYKRVLLGDSSVNQGMLTENAVAQQLKASGHDLFFYSKWSTQAAERMEVDFLTIQPFRDAADKPRVSPIEVKSSNRYKITSLKKFKSKFGSRVGTQYVLHPRQLIVEDGIVRLPLYMSGWI
jgi:uncharacterized protein